MLLSYNGLVKLVEHGWLTNVDSANINAASIDLTLAPILLVETEPPSICPKCSVEVDIMAALDFRKNSPEHIQCPKCKQMSYAHAYKRPIDVRRKEEMKFIQKDCAKTMGGYVLDPGECVLASTVEEFNLPNHIATEYKLKSSMARVFLGHLLAGWADPGFHGSNLTLELKNESRYHKLLLVAGMKIGQVVCWETEEVPNEKSYATVGRYNQSQGVVAGKGVI